MNHGGKRANQGRKHGSQNIPRLSDYFTSKEIEEFAKDMMKRAKKSDVIAKWVGEHLYQKPPLPVDASVTGELHVVFDKVFETAP